MQTWICTIEFIKPTAWPRGKIAIRTGCTITYHFWVETRGQEGSIDLFFFNLLNTTLEMITISVTELITSKNLQT